MKNKIIRCLLLSLTLTFAFSSVFAQSGQPSHRESVFACAYSLCDDSDQSIDCYMTRQTTSNPIVNGKIMKGEFWLVFADLMPEANWEHPCKYIYVSDNKEDGEYTVAVVDSVRPPHSGDFEPMKLSQITRDRMELESSEKAKRAGAARMMKSGPLPIYSTPFSSKTYAVILSGGLSPADNAGRYWNDCSYMYKTLTRNFGLPKENVKVLMSDGKSPGLDRNLNISFSPDLDSSPLDLDGDGECDIDFSASKDTLAMVFDELKNKLTDNDHLLVFVTDHGGYDEYNDKSYINLWNGERLYPDEFASYFNGFNAGYVSFVLGQCYSGGFIPALKADNHIVMTACAEKELSYRCRAFDLNYNEFLYHWISALNRTDTFGNTLPVSQTLPNGKLAPVTLKRAFDYAVEKDAYNKGKTNRSVENPQISILKGSTAEDLALDSISPTVYLCITDGSVLKPRPMKNTPEGVKWVRDCDWINFWNSSDVWLRNQDDGIENQINELPNISDTKRDIYVYTKIRNRGVKPYIGEGWSLASWWAESSLIIPKSVWEGKYVNTKSMAGGLIKNELIEDPIAPGDSLVVGYCKVFSKKELSKMNDGGKYICLISNVFRDDEASEFEGTDDEYVLSVWDTDRLAQCNRIEVKKKFDEKEFFSLNVFNSAREDLRCSVELHTYDIEEPVMNKVRMKMNLSPELMQSWKNNGSAGADVVIDMSNNNSILMNSDTAKVVNITMLPMQKGKVSFSFNKLAKEAVNEYGTKQIDVAVYDAVTGQCLGGETFIIPLTPRQAISPEIVKTLNADGTYTLTATNINEEADYEWYDKDGRLIGKGKTITVPANSSNVEYSVEVKAKSDAAISNATMAVERVLMVNEIVGSREGADVSFNTPVREGTKARILSTTGQAKTYEYNLEKGVKKCSLPIPDSSPGVYQFMLVEGGKVMETKKFIK